MSKTIFEQIEDIGKRVIAQNGDCVMIFADGQSNETQCTIHCHSKDSYIGLLVRFLQVNPELIPATLHAVAIAMEYDGDCEDCQLCDYDDGEDEEEDDEYVCLN